MGYETIGRISKRANWLYVLCPMSVPKDRTPERLKQRLIDYTKAYKQLEGKTTEMIAKELLPF